MNRSRVLGSCLVAWLFSPLLSSAQLPPQTSAPPFSDSVSSRVSAHELRIPRKAIKAFNKGTKLLAEGNASRSIPEFQRAIKAFPDFYEAYYKIGLAGLNLHRYPDAEAAFTRSIEVSRGRYAPADFGLGVVLCIEKRFADSEEAIHTGLNLDATDAAGHFTLAWVLFTEGRLADAEKSARHAVLSDPKLATAYLLLAQIHLRQNETSALVADLDAYLKLDPNGPYNIEARAVRAQAEGLLAKQHGNAPAVAKTPNP